MSGSDPIKFSNPVKFNGAPGTTAMNGLLNDLASQTGRFSQSTRPMLSRDADSMFWMARYVERSEHVARFLLVNSTLLIDVGDLAPAVQKHQWLSLLQVLRGATPLAVPAVTEGSADGPVAQRVARYLAFDRENPSSLY